MGRRAAPLTPDVNVLVAAARADHPHHSVAYAWLVDASGATARGARLTLLPMVAIGFVRVVTQRRIFPVPTPTVEAVAFIRVLLEEGGAAVGELGAEWPEFAQSCLDGGLTGGDITDAWIAAAVLAHHEHLVTFDRGFRRFLKPRDVTVLHP